MWARRWPQQKHWTLHWAASGAGGTDLSHPTTEPISLCPLSHPSAHRVFIPTSAGFLAKLLWDWLGGSAEIASWALLQLWGCQVPPNQHPPVAKELGQATAPPVGPHVPVHKPSHGEAQSEGWFLHVNLLLPKRMAILVVPSSGLLLVLQISVFFPLSYSWALLFLGSTGEQLQQWENGKNNTNPAYSSWHWQPECCLVWQRAETLTGLIPKQVSTICTWTASKHSLC